MGLLDGLVTNHDAENVLCVLLRFAHLAAKAARKPGRSRSYPDGYGQLGRGDKQCLRNKGEAHRVAMANPEKSDPLLCGAGWARLGMGGRVLWGESRQGGGGAARARLRDARAPVGSGGGGASAADATAAPSAWHLRCAAQNNHHPLCWTPRNSHGLGATKGRNHKHCRHKTGSNWSNTTPHIPTRSPTNSVNRTQPTQQRHHNNFAFRATALGPSCAVEPPTSLRKGWSAMYNMTAPLATTAKSPVSGCFGGAPLPRSRCIPCGVARGSKHVPMAQSSRWATQRQAGRRQRSAQLDFWAPVCGTSLL